MNDDEELSDERLSAILRRQADELTGPIDTDVALRSVRRRIRQRRTWRVVGSTLAAAAAVTIAIVAVGALADGDRTTLRTPAGTADGGVTVPPTPSTPTAETASTASTTTTAATTTTVPPTSTTAPPVVGSPTATTLPTPAPPPATAPAAGPPTTTVAVPTTTAALPTTTVTMPPAPPSTSTFASIGGSIVVRQAGGTIALDGSPSPTSGWTYRIDDDGPTRVRVRFELDNRRSEIRVDLEGGQLVPEIVEQ